MTIDLKLFCDPNDPVRPWLGQPFSAGAWTYATDGHIAVRVPRLEDVAENPAAPAEQATPVPVNVFAVTEQGQSPFLSSA